MPYLQEQGFRVWPSSWKDEKAALALLRYARAHRTERLLGHLCTTWVRSHEVARALLGEGDPAVLSESAVQAAGSLRACFRELAAPSPR